MKFNTRRLELVRRRFASLACIIGIIIGGGSSIAQADEPIVGAGGGDHLWYIIPNPPGSEGWKLNHHSSLDGEATYQVFETLVQWPAKFGAWGNHAWMVFPQIKEGGRQLKRGVYSIAAEPGPVPGMYQADPPKHLNMEPSLPGTGRLVDFVGAAGGPLALLLPTQHAGAGIESGPDSQAASTVLLQPLLLQLRGQEWIEIPLPEQFGSKGQSHIAPAGRDGRSICILTPDRPRPGLAEVNFLSAEGKWDTFLVEMNVARIRDLVWAGGQVLVVEDLPGGDEVRFSHVRPSGLMELAKLPNGGSPQSVVGMGDGLRILSSQRDGGVSIQQVSVVTGRLGSIEQLELQSFPPEALWRVLMLMVLVGSVVYLVFGQRGGEATEVELPGQFTPLSPMLRGVALGLDMLPGGVLAMSVLDCGLEDLILHPIFGSDLDHALAFGLMLVVTFIHSLLGELLGSSSLGKMLVGAKVIDIKGERPTSGQVIRRNLLKLIVLAIPPLVLTMFRTRSLRGIPEMSSSTIVVQGVKEGEKH